MNIREVFNKSDGGDIFGLTKSANFTKIASEMKHLNEGAIQVLIEGESLTMDIRSLLGKTESYNGKIGQHPDFVDLSGNETRKQYIVSVFADIQGSTNLVFKYDLEVVRLIKNKILTTAIEIFQGCDGHIHRLQGDAIFAYFGDNDHKISDSVINALNACSLLQAYINEHIKSQFEKIGVDPIKLRVGVDLGYSDDVLWSKYGLNDCYEITTTSLHTDLASKLQGKCPANKIMVGENVMRHLDIPTEFVSVISNASIPPADSDKYIIVHGNNKYRMWQFNWEKYVKSYNFFSNNDVFDKVEMKCTYSDSEGTRNMYISNSCALPKNLILNFTLFGLSNLQNYDIQWTIINRGEEATKDTDTFGQTTTKEKELERGKISCKLVTAYKGHHYMRCKIYEKGYEIGCRNFGVYVNND